MTLERSAGQYEPQFKKWGFRKNLTGEEWTTVSRRINKRKRDGKETELRISGVWVPVKKRQKALAWYGQGSTLDLMNYKHQHEPNVTPPTPEGVTFSPPATTILSCLDCLSVPIVQFSQFMLPSLMSPANSLKHSFASLSCQENADLRRLGCAYFPAMHDLPLCQDPSIMGEERVRLCMLSFFGASNHIEALTLDGFLSPESLLKALDILHPSQGPRDLQALVKQFRINTSPTFDTLAEQLFVHSLESGNVNHARALLALTSINLNELLACTPEEYPVSPRLSLEIAIDAGNLEMIRLLIEHGASVKLIGRHYVRYAELYSNEEFMRSLLPFFEGDILTAWMESLRHGNDACTELLWDRLIGSEKESHEVINEAFIAAIKHGAVSNVRELLRRGADVNFTSERNDQSPLTALQLAVDGRRNVEDMVKMLVEAGAKIDTDLDLKSSEERAFTPLELAIFHRDYGVASFLISQGANVNTPMHRCSYGRYSPWTKANALKLAVWSTTFTVSYENFVMLLLMTPGACVDEESFAFAVQNGDDLMIETLSSFGAPYCSVAVLVAFAGTGRLDIAQRCLDAGANIDGLWDWQTPLLVALEHKAELGRLFEETWRFFLHKGASVNVPGAYQSPLSMAFAVGDEPLIISLLNMGARCDGYTSIFYHSKVFNERPDLIEIVIHRGACIRRGDLEEVARTHGEDFILALAEKDPENGVNLSSKCMFEMFNWISLHHGDLSWIEVFVSAGIPWELPGDTNYSPSCRFGSRPDFSSDTYSQPLHNLVSQGHLEAAQFFLGKGADPNIIAIEKYATGMIQQIHLLNCAVVIGQIDAVRLLLEAGSNVNHPAMGALGRTALQAAIDEGEFEIMDELLAQGADVDAPAAEDAGVTALQAAAIHGYLGIAVRLVELGADVNAAAARQDGRTALEGASEHGRVDMVQFLLNAGADVQSPEFGKEQHRRAVRFARERAFPAVARLLERHRSTFG